MRWVAPSEKDTATATLEKRLWDAADQFRANSGLKSQEYSAPVLGLIFLRFAEVRFAAQRAKLEKAEASSRRGSRVEEPAAYHAHGILYLPDSRNADADAGWVGADAVAARTDSGSSASISRHWLAWLAGPFGANNGHRPFRIAELPVGLPTSCLVDRIARTVSKRPAVDRPIDVCSQRVRSLTDTRRPCEHDKSCTLNGGGIDPRIAWSACTHQPFQ